MASPKVFVSSTCFDLGEVRDSLREFIKSFGFEPILSDYGDVFFHPDSHTHEACVNEVDNCDLFVLIIGGRFGGNYVNDTSKSITNAEYDAAVKRNIPVFVYIKKDVLENHHIYLKNKKDDDEEFRTKIIYPAIHQQKDAISIFEFINSVRSTTINNAYQPFELAKDIEEQLRKQWAGMFFDYLKLRAIKNDAEKTNDLLSSLKNSSEKLEEIVEKIYSSVDKDNSKDEIERIDKKSQAKSLLDKITSAYSGIVFEDEDDKKRILSVQPAQYDFCYKYLVEIGKFSEIQNNEKSVLVISKPSGQQFTIAKNSDGEPNLYKALYKKFQNLEDEIRKELLDNYLKERPSNLSDIFGKDME